MLNFSNFRSPIGGLITELQWIFWFFLTFRPLNLYFGGLNDRIYEHFEFFRPFDLSNSTLKVYMIKFTGYIEFFSRFQPLDMRSQLSILPKLLIFFDLSTFWPLVWTSNYSILVNILNFSTFRSFIGGIITGVHWIFWIFRPFDLSTSTSEV